MFDDSEQNNLQLAQTKDSRTLGLGLAMVAGILRNMVCIVLAPLIFNFVVEALTER
jgi:hypothetical protein